MNGFKDLLVIKNHFQIINYFMCNVDTRFQYNLKVWSFTFVFENHCLRDKENSLGNKVP